MSRYLIVMLVIWVAALNGTLAAQSAPALPGSAAKIRVGVYDSRAVALAYYNSAEHRKFMQQMMADFKAAKAANDSQKIAELEYRGPAIQNLMHYQVFSNASIPNVMEQLAPHMNAIGEEARVVVVVSKWDVTYRRGDVEYVDVTEALVRHFAPDEKVQKWIASGKDKPPIPLLEAVMTLRPER